MRGFRTWLLAVLAWTLVLLVGRYLFGVRPTFGELLVVGLAGMVSAFVVVLREEL